MMYAKMVILLYKMTKVGMLKVDPTNPSHVELIRELADNFKEDMKESPEFSRSVRQKLYSMIAYNLCRSAETTAGNLC